MSASVVDPALARIVEHAAGRSPGQLRPDTRLDELGLDSLARIDLAVAAEDHFGVPIPDDDLERFVTLGDLLAFVQRAKA